MGTVDNSFKDAVVEYLCDVYEAEEDIARNAVDNAAKSDAPTFYRNTSAGTAEWVAENSKFWNVS